MAASDAQWYRLEGDLLQRLKGRYEAALEVPQRREASECCCCHRTRDFWYSKPGETEFQMSQVCEYCFDVLTQEVPTAQRQRQCTRLTLEGHEVAAQWLTWRKCKLSAALSKKEMRRSVSLAVGKTALPKALT